MVQKNGKEKVIMVELLGIFNGKTDHLAKKYKNQQSKLPLGGGPK